MALAVSKIRIVLALVAFLIILQTCRIFMSRDYGESSEQTSGDKSHLLQVSVYYEALCPDSKHFFIHHLEPTYLKLKSDMTINLVPYGKAKTRTSPSGDISFECQHGELECLANRIHACAIDSTPDVEEQLAITTCMIKDNLNPEDALNRCASSGDFNNIMECANGVSGFELLKNHGEETDAIKPSFIPTIYINRSKGNQALLLKDFMKEICTYYTSSTKPLACS